MAEQPIITLEMLRDKYACPSQIELFEDLFGSSVQVTRELCLRYANDFNWSWAERNLLSVRQKREYASCAALLLGKEYSFNEICAVSFYDAFTS